MCRRGCRRRRYHRLGLGAELKLLARDHEPWLDLTTADANAAVQHLEIEPLALRLPGQIEASAFHLDEVRSGQKLPTPPSFGGHRDPHSTLLQSHAPPEVVALDNLALAAHSEQDGGAVLKHERTVLGSSGQCARNRLWRGCDLRWVGRLDVFAQQSEQQQGDSDGRRAEHPTPAPCWLWSRGA